MAKRWLLLQEFNGSSPRFLGFGQTTQFDWKWWMGLCMHRYFPSLLENTDLFKCLSPKKTAKSQQWGLMGGGDKVKRVPVTQYMQVCGWLFLPTLNSHTLFTMCQRRSPGFESSTRLQRCVEPGHLFLVLTRGLCMSLYLCTSAARVWLSQLPKVPHTCRVFTHWDTCFTH